MSLGGYEIIRSIGKGSFGEVFLALTGTPGGFQKQVAVKRLRDTVTDEPELVERFAIEARICGYLQHPNIIHVYNFLKTPDGYLLIMEYLDGRDLGQILSAFNREQRVMPLRLVLELGIQLCEGLHFAHTARGSDGTLLGLVHRDIKPGNLMVTRDGLLKILDFGVARTDFARTRSEFFSLKGTLRYMAPEQAAGGRIDASSDQFTVALLLAEMLLGYPVYDAELEHQLYFMATTAAVEGPLSVLRTHHPAMAEVLSRALNLSPESRYPDMGALALALQGVLLTAPEAVRPAQLVQRLADGEPIGQLFGVIPAWPLLQTARQKSQERLRELARGLAPVMPEMSTGSSLKVDALVSDDTSLVTAARPVGLDEGAVARSESGAPDGDITDPIAAPVASPVVAQVPAQAPAQVSANAPTDADVLSQPTRWLAAGGATGRVLPADIPSDVHAAETRVGGWSALHLSPVQPVSSGETGPDASSPPEDGRVQALPQPVSGSLDGLSEPRLETGGGRTMGSLLLGALLAGLLALTGAAYLYFWVPTPADPGARQPPGAQTRAVAEHQADADNRAVAANQAAETLQGGAEVQKSPGAGGLNAIWPASGGSEAAPGPSAEARGGGNASAPATAPANVWTGAGAHTAQALGEAAGRSAAPTGAPGGALAAGGSHAGDGNAPAKAVTAVPREKSVSASERASVDSRGASSEGVARPAPAAPSERPAGEGARAGGAAETASETGVVATSAAPAFNFRFRVRPTTARVIEVATGQVLSCWSGCTLTPGAHTLRIEQEDGRSLTWSVTVTADAALSCVYTADKDPTPWCK